MRANDMPGSGQSYVSRGVFRTRPGRAEKKWRAVGLTVALCAAGLADASHRVATGDNLSRIARRYGVDVRSIAAANGIRNIHLIRAGSLLRIPPAAPAGTRSSGRPRPARLSTHRVVPGENLTRIARKYGTTVRELVALNTIRDPAYLQAGHTLKVPGGGRTKAASHVRSPAPQPAAPVAAIAAAVQVPIHPVSLPVRPPLPGLPASRPAVVEDLIELYSQKFGIQPALMKGLAWQESGWKQHVVSPAGAIGVMQVLPETGSFISRHLLKKPVDLNNREQNIEAGIAFFAFYLSKTSGDERTAVAGYFQGLRSVWQNGVSERTQRYVGAVLALRDRFGS